MACSAVKYRNIKVVNYNSKHQFVDLSVGSNSLANKIITANLFWMAVLWQHSPVASASNIAILPIGRARQASAPVPLLSGHTGVITDMMWNPFCEWMLASSSTDGSIKLWLLPENGLVEPYTTSLATIYGSKKRVDAVQWHPVAANILASGESDCRVRVWDINRPDSEQLKVNPLTSGVNSISWNYDGSLLAAVTKEKKLQVIDPRTNRAFSETPISDGPASNSHTCWLGNSYNIITSSLDKLRNRTVLIWDSRKLSKPSHTHKFNNSSTSMKPMFDNDTQLLFLFARGDSTVYCYGFSEDGSLVELSAENLRVPHTSVCLAPKLLCDVRNGNVARIYRSTDKAIFPMGYNVFRKNIDMSEFQLNTPCYEPGLTADAWLQGQNKPPVSIDITDHATLITN
ncbi:coronin-B-like [Schistocerca gregaria]|uniref:coronin-B-like n=1 Tax=Schistocerca gregaria TaxID=7010 RepID=UPI00211EEC77|nr:coronin-B-like [Schistocerca gregaria]XP_049847786.1 coronin-B-like [Schistocerca gregaria]